MMRNAVVAVLVIAVILSAVVTAGTAHAAPLSISQIQYTDNPTGDSDYWDSQTLTGTEVDCAGGIVIFKYSGFNERVFLYDPAGADGWGGIIVKDFTGRGLYDSVNIGDWVSFTSIMVEEYRGNTQLAFIGGADDFTVESTGNSLPDPIVVGVADITAPTEQGDDDWLVADHSAEKYEAMYLQVNDVTVVEMGLGKAQDNYVLQDPAGRQCWAADYLNVDLPPNQDYHPGVGIGSAFTSVSGVIEQYTRTSRGWDYYQLITTGAGDFVPEPTTTALLMAGGAALFHKRRASR